MQFLDLLKRTMHKNKVRNTFYIFVKIKKKTFQKVQSVYLKCYFKMFYYQFFDSKQDYFSKKKKVYIKLTTNLCTKEYDILCDAVKLINFLLCFSGGTLHLHPDHPSLVPPRTPGLLPKGLWSRARAGIAASYRISPATSVLRPALVRNATSSVFHK